jgi:deazaflavin-dependent oxidoreductase (nitroreductase family)
MAKTYQVSTVNRLANRVILLLTRLELTSTNTCTLTTKGRRSGKEYSTPVILVQSGGKRWLVSPYGNVNWVLNTRAAGRVKLTRGGRSEMVVVQELGPVESAPILKQYLTEVPIVQPYFDVQPTSPLEAFEQEAARHPVFSIGRS